MKIKYLTILAALTLSLCVTASYGQSILLGGFDGTNTVSGTSYTDANQDIGAVGKVNATAAVTSGSTAKSLGWGGNAFVFDNPGTVSFTITNTGTGDVTLDRFLFTTYRDNLAGGPPDQVTIAYASGNLAGSSGVQSLGAAQAGSFDFDLGGILTDATLAPGESATFTFESIPADLSGSNRRIRYDDMQITGSIAIPPAGPVDPAVSTVVASPTEVLADGTSSSTITVTLKDAASTPNDGKSVTLSGSTGNATISPAGAQTTNASGQVTFTVSSSTVETETFTATDVTDSPTEIVITQTADVTFSSIAVDAGTSTVLASPGSVTADGSATSTITVTLNNTGSVPLPGKSVSLVGSTGNASISPSGSQTTDANGQVTFTVSSNTAETETFTATGDSVGITQTAAVEFTAPIVVGPVDAGTSTVIASPASVPANGTTLSTITITLKDAAGLAVEGSGVSLSNTSGPGAASISPVDIQATDTNGQATFTVTSTTAGTEVFTATAITDSVIITQTASVTFEEVPPPLLVLLLDDPVASSTSDTSGTVANLHDTDMSLSYIGTRTNEGGAFLIGDGDSDGFAGDSIASFTVIYDMGDTVTFDGFIHAQRHESDLSSVDSIDFWVSNSDPGSDFTAIANAYYGTTPQATKALDRGDRLLHEYAFDGAKLTGRYVIMRFHMTAAGGSPGGYTFQLGQTASVGDYDTWSAGFPNLGISSEDDDGDGLTNEEERLFGLDPLNASSANPYSSGFSPGAGTFSYNRRAQALTGMTYKTWYSTDLNEWFWESGASESIGAPVNDIETVAVSLSPTLLNEPKLFVRISAEDFGLPPQMNQVWGSGNQITMRFTEPMGSTATFTGNYSVEEDGGGSIAVTGAELSSDGLSVTLTLGASLGNASSFTVTTNGLANSVGQPLGNGTTGQFQTWDDDPNGIKVFILAGQSNMVGYGKVEQGGNPAWTPTNGEPKEIIGGLGCLRYIAIEDAADDNAYPEYDYASLLADPSQPTTSGWKTRPDVKLWWKNGGLGNLDGPLFKGDLGPLTNNNQWFGPEFAFGQIIGDFYPDDDVLIIKAAWGGHKLVSNFRPPSAVAKRGGEVGASYLEMFDDARQVLENLGTEFPEWAGRGYQIVGVGWHQGTSDKAPDAGSPEYKDNLPDFISDVRAEFAKPNLPFVIATTGMNDAGPAEPSPYTGYSLVEQAQLWVAGVPQPANVRSTDTRPFWREPAVSPSTTTFHWNHSAESYFLVGKALGEDMVTLLNAE